MIGAMPARVYDRGPEGRRERWWIRVSIGGGRRRQFPLRDAPPGEEGRAYAERAAAKLNAQEDARRRWGRPGSDEALPAAAMLRAWADVWGPLRSVRTQATDRALIERLAAFFGPRDLRDLREADAARFVARVLEDGRSGDLAANALSILRRVLRLAVAEGLLPRDPIPALGRVIGQARLRTRSEGARRDAWTRGEVATLLRLAAAHEPRLHTVLLVALHTGARRGEILALGWEDVDFARGAVHFRRALAGGGGGGTKLPKTRRTRTTPLSAVLAAALRAERRRQESARIGTPPEIVCPAAGGQRWSERYLHRAYTRLLRRATDVRPLPFHCTRHTFISWALEAGHPVVRVARWVGASPRVLEAHYAHALPAAAEEAMSFLEARS